MNTGEWDEGGKRKWEWENLYRKVGENIFWVKIFVIFKLEPLD